MTRPSPLHPLLVPVARALRRWSDSILRDPAAAPPAPPRPELAGAPAHWLELARRHAPHLLDPGGMAEVARQPRRDAVEEPIADLGPEPGRDAASPLALTDATTGAATASPPAPEPPARRRDDDDDKEEEEGHAARGGPRTSDPAERLRWPDPPPAPARAATSAAVASPPSGRAGPGPERFRPHRPRSPVLGPPPGMTDAATAPRREAAVALVEPPAPHKPRGGRIAPGAPPAPPRARGLDPAGTVATAALPPAARSSTDVPSPPPRPPRAAGPARAFEPAAEDARTSRPSSPREASPWPAAPPERRARLEGRDPWPALPDGPPSGPRDPVAAPDRSRVDPATTTASSPLDRWPSLPNVDLDQAGPDLGLERFLTRLRRHEHERGEP